MKKSRWRASLCFRPGYAAAAILVAVFGYRTGAPEGIYALAALVAILTFDLRIIRVSEPYDD